MQNSKHKKAGVDTLLPKKYTLKQRVEVKDLQN